MFCVQVFDGGEEERRPVRGFGGDIGGDALVPPVWEERTGLGGGCVLRGGEQAREGGGDGCECWVAVREGEECGGDVHDFIVDSNGYLEGRSCRQGGGLPRRSSEVIRAWPFDFSVDMAAVVVVLMLMFVL